VQATRTPAGWRSFSGRRTSNQDSVVAGRLGDGRELIAVADGMGGHQGGEVASQRALDTLVASLEAGRSLRESMADANAAVYQAAQDNAAWTGMGTTLVALLRSGDRYYVANVGDSRAYCVSDRAIRQITDDHSFLAEALRANQMTAEAARTSRWRNALTRAIGTDAQVEVDVFGPFDVQPSDTVVLCSDGLHGSISDEAMLSCIRQNQDVWGAAMCLADQAYRNGSTDNISVVVISFAERIRVNVSGSPIPQAAPKPFRLIMAPQRSRQRSLLQRLFTLFT
jgi:protein phosphatase